MTTSDFRLYVTEGDSGSANPLQGELVTMSGAYEVGFNLASYTGTFTLRQIKYRGSLTSNPSSGSSGVLTDTKASGIFIASEHASSRVMFTSGRAYGKTVAVTANTASGSLTTSSNVFGTLRVRSGDDFIVYTTKVDAAGVTVTSAADGLFQYNWASGNLNTPGEYIGEFKFSHTSAAGRVIHFPVGDNGARKIQISVVPALDV